MFSLKVHLLDEQHQADADCSSESSHVAILKGRVHLFRDIRLSDPELDFDVVPNLDCDKICILGAPCTRNPGELFPLSESIRRVECFRNDGVQVILLQFDSHTSANEFHRLHSRNLLPAEAGVRHLLPISTVEYTSSSSEASRAPPGLTELPACPVCLERLDENISGVPTTLTETLSAHDSCLVCRYCTQPETTTCSACPTSEDLWVCMICTFVGCGRYKEGHAIKHWINTKHSYSLKLEKQQIWDYTGDKYVHRIIQSTTDGNLVELSAPSSDRINECSSCSRQPDPYDHAYSSKLQGLEFEYNSLLASQSENQRKYYEERLDESQVLRERQEQEVADAIEKVAQAKVLKLQEKLGKIEEENKFLSEMNECLAENEKGWEKKMNDLAERGKLLMMKRDESISRLEKQVRTMMESLENTA